MPIFNVTSDDTLTIFGRIMNDFADGKTTTITFPNDFANVVTGKNGNGIISKNANGGNSVLTLRLMRGSSDDNFLQAKIASAQADFVAQELATGEFVKRLGDGAGEVKRDVYTLLGGTFSKIAPDAEEDVSGTTDQAVAVYTIKFIKTLRSIQ